MRGAKKTADKSIENYVSMWGTSVKDTGPRVKAMQRENRRIEKHTEDIELKLKDRTAEKVRTIPFNELTRFLWAEGELSYKLWPQQVQIYNQIRKSSATTVVVLSSRQFGKSFLGALLALEDAIRNPGVTIPIVGPTIEQTVDIVNQSLKIITQDAPRNTIQRAKSEKRWVLNNDSEIIIGGFDTKTATRQRGKRAYKVYIEEVVDSNPDYYREAMRSDLGPLLTHSPNPQMVFLSTPPRFPDHPFLLETVSEAKNQGAFYKYTIYDNKALSPAQFDACVRRCGGVDTIEFKREYLCEVVRDTSLVCVPRFNRSTHVKRFELPVRCHYFITVDWGGVRDKTVALLHTYNYLDAVDLIVDEIKWDSNTTTQRILDGIIKWYDDFHPVAIYADMPGQTAVDVANEGIVVIPAPKKDWEASLNNVNVRFGNDKVLVHPRCQFLIKTLESAIFNKQRSDFLRTEDLGHADALATLMYALQVQDRTDPYAVMGLPKMDRGTIGKGTRMNLKTFGIFKK